MPLRHLHHHQIDFNFWFVNRLLCEDHTEEETHSMVRRGRFRVEPSVRLSNVTQARWFFQYIHYCLCPHSTQTLRTWKGGSTPDVDEAVDVALVSRTT